jgi:hypothetical protein
MRLARGAKVAVGMAVAWLAAWLLACSTSGTVVGGTDAAHDAPADAGREATGVGIINFSQTPDGGGSFAAGFTESLPPAADAGCTVVDAGSCTTTSCPAAPAADGGSGDARAPSDAGADGETSFGAPNPGRMRVTGGVFGQGFDVDPARDGLYLYASPGALFSPGDELGVSAEGAKIPGFSSEVVTAPPAVTMTAPVGDSGTLAIATSQSLEVRWTGGRAGDHFVFNAGILFTTGATANMSCSWDASEGTGTVPSAALRPLAAENAIVSGVQWFELAQTKFTTGDVDVSLSAWVLQGSAAAFQ